MPSKISLFNPCSNEHDAFKDFKRLDFAQKSLIAILTAVATIFSLGLCSVYCFRSLVKGFKKLDPQHNEEVQKVNTEAQKYLQPQQPEKAQEEPNLPQDIKIDVRKDLIKPLQQIPPSQVRTPLIDKQDMFPQPQVVSVVNQNEAQLVTAVVQKQKEKPTIRQTHKNEVKKITDVQPININPVEIETPFPLDIPQDFKDELMRIVNKYSNLGIFLLCQTGTRLDHITLPITFNNFQAKHKSMIFIALRYNKVDYADNPYVQEMKNFFNIDDQDSRSKIVLIPGTINARLDMHTNQFLKTVVEKDALLNKIEDELKLMSR